MSFFMKKSQDNRGVKRRKLNKTVNGINKKQANKHDDEEISSNSDDEDGEKEVDIPSEDEETEQEKKLRLTKKYLQQIEEEESKNTLPNRTRQAVASRLKEDALEEEGRLLKNQADRYVGVDPEVLCVLKGHKLSVTCLAISSCEKYLYSASKDCSIIKWSIETQKRLKTIPGGRKGTEATHIGHTNHILALALSSDNKFLASGCKNKIINIWNPETMELLKTFRGHKDEVTCLAFQKNSHQLISASSDRSLKLWSLDDLAYIETLFGHQDGVTSLDCFMGGNALSSGGRDGSLRVWKIIEESQLVFQAYEGSMDCACVTSPNKFVSGADDGTLFLWGVFKKKPLYEVKAAHGIDSESGLNNWIVSICSLPNADVLASGSKDGCIRIWHRVDRRNILAPINELPLNGFINVLQFSPSGKFLIAGVGQEHRLGRWWRIKEAKNSIVIYSWPNKS